MSSGELGGVCTISYLPAVPCKFSSRVLCKIIAMWQPILSNQIHFAGKSIPTSQSCISAAGAGLPRSSDAAASCPCLPPASSPPSVLFNMHLTDFCRGPWPASLFLSLSTLHHHQGILPSIVHTCAGSRSRSPSPGLLPLILSQAFIKQKVHLLRLGEGARSHHPGCCCMICDGIFIAKPGLITPSPEQGHLRCFIMRSCRLVTNWSEKQKDLLLLW